MREITDIKEIQNITLGILKEIKRICDSYGVLYYLDAGTLLGAVRHKGFIPWDDDVDICMLRSEYNKFIEAFRKSSKQKYKLLSLETDEKYSLPLPKVVDTRTKLIQLRQNEYEYIGVYVDIFVYDNIPDSESERMYAFSRQALLQKRWNRFQYKPNSLNTPKQFMRKIIQYALKPINIQRFFALKINKFAVTYNNICTEYIGTMTYVCRREHEIYRRNWFGKGIEVPFEDALFRIPEDWDSFLRSMYGEYMELPPIEQRVSHHEVKIYWIN